MSLPISSNDDSLSLRHKDQDPLTFHAIDEGARLEAQDQDTTIQESESTLRVGAKDAKRIQAGDAVGIPQGASIAITTITKKTPEPKKDATVTITAKSESEDQTDAEIIAMGKKDTSVNVSRHLDTTVGIIRNTGLTTLLEQDPKAKERAELDEEAQKGKNHLAILQKALKLERDIDLTDKSKRDVIARNPLILGVSVIIEDDITLYRDNQDEIDKHEAQLKTVDDEIAKVSAARPVDQKALKSYEQAKAHIQDTMQQLKDASPPKMRKYITYEVQLKNHPEGNLRVRLPFDTDQKFDIAQSNLTPENRKSHFDVWAVNADSRAITNACIVKSALNPCDPNHARVQEHVDNLAKEPILNLMADFRNVDDKKTAFFKSDDKGGYKLVEHLAAKRISFNFGTTGFDLPMTATAFTVNEVGLRVISDSAKVGAFTTGYIGEYMRSSKGTISDPKNILKGLNLIDPRANARNIENMRMDSPGLIKYLSDHPGVKDDYFAHLVEKEKELDARLTHFREGMLNKSLTKKILSLGFHDGRSLSDIFSKELNPSSSIFSRKGLFFWHRKNTRDKIDQGEQNTKRLKDELDNLRLKLQHAKDQVNLGISSGVNITEAQKNVADFEKDIKKAEEQLKTQEEDLKNLNVELNEVDAAVVKFVEYSAVVREWNDVANQMKAIVDDESLLDLTNDKHKALKARVKGPGFVPFTGISLAQREKDLQATGRLMAQATGRATEETFATIGQSAALNLARIMESRVKSANQQYQSLLSSEGEIDKEIAANPADKKPIQDKINGVHKGLMNDFIKNKTEITAQIAVLQAEQTSLQAEADRLKAVLADATTSDPRHDNLFVLNELNEQIKKQLEAARKFVEIQDPTEPVIT